MCCYLYLWICAVLTYPQGVPERYCCAVFLLTKCAVAYICEFELFRLRTWHLNLLSNTIAERIDEWTAMCLHYSLYSWRKSEQVFPRDIFHLRDSSKSFFSIHKTSLFLVVSTNTYVYWRYISSLQFMSDPVFFQNNLYHCYLIQFFDWLLK